MTDTIKPEDFGAAFDDWISGGTLSQQSVDIYANPGLFAEYQQLDRELEVAKASAEADEESQADSKVADIEERMAALYEQWMASKSTWTVRAIPPADSKELSAKYPELPVPEEPAADASEDVKAKYAADVEAYEKRSSDRNYAILERVIMKIQYPTGVVVEAQLADDEVTILKPAITAEQLAKMRARLGVIQYMKLIGASKLAATTEPVIPAPFSRSSSKTAQT